MESGILAGIGGLTTALLLIVMAVVVVLVVSMHITRSYESAKKERTSAMSDIRRCREERIALIKRVLNVFSEGNAHAENLHRLLEMNSKVDSEKKELLWEEKYVSVMKKFMKVADGGDPMKEVALSLSRDSVEENENALVDARHRYARSVTLMSRYEAFPLSLFLRVGLAIQETIIRKEAKKKAVDDDMLDDDLLSFDADR